LNSKVVSSKQLPSNEILFYFSEIYPVKAGANMNSSVGSFDCPLFEWQALTPLSTTSFGCLNSLSPFKILVKDSK
jgi:hypothetical protein